MFTWLLALAFPVIMLGFVISAVMDLEFGGTPYRHFMRWLKPTEVDLIYNDMKQNPDDWAFDERWDIATHKTGKIQYHISEIKLDKNKRPLKCTVADYTRFGRVIKKNRNRNLEETSHLKEVLTSLKYPKVPKKVLRRKETRKVKDLGLF